MHTPSVCAPLPTCATTVKGIIAGREHPSRMGSVSQVHWPTRLNTALLREQDRQAKTQISSHVVHCETPSGRLCQKLFTPCESGNLKFINCTIRVKRISEGNRDGPPSHLETNARHHVFSALYYQAIIKARQARIGSERAKNKRARIALLRLSSSQGSRRENFHGRH